MKTDRSIFDLHKVKKLYKSISFIYHDILSSFEYAREMMVSIERLNSLSSFIERERESATSFSESNDRAISKVVLNYIAYRSIRRLPT